MTKHPYVYPYGLTKHWHANLSFVDETTVNSSIPGFSYSVSLTFLMPTKPCNAHNGITACVQSATLCSLVFLDSVHVDLWCWNANTFSIASFNMSSKYPHHSLTPFRCSVFMNMCVCIWLRGGRKGDLNIRLIFQQVPVHYNSVNIRLFVHLLKQHGIKI